MESIGKRISTAEGETVESARIAMGQRALKSLRNKKEKLPKMVFVSMVRKDARRLWIKDLTKGKGRSCPERQRKCMMKHASVALDSILSSQSRADKDLRFPYSLLRNIA